MALINCEECGREVSSRAIACPACGCPIAAEQQPEVAESVAEESQTAKPKPQPTVTEKFMDAIGYQPPKPGPERSTTGSVFMGLVHFFITLPICVVLFIWLFLAMSH